MTTTAPTISATQLAALFPFSVSFDDAFVVTSVGASSARILGLSPGDAFTSVLTFERPSGPMTPQVIAGHPQTLFVVRSRSGLALRGQMLRLPEQGQTIFLCTPLLHDASLMAKFDLGYADFAVHDPTLELAQVARSQEIALDDLRRLADRLKGQREALAVANASLERQSTEAKKLALIASRTDNGVVITDANGRTEWVNDAFVRMTGRTIEELRGRKPGDVLRAPGADPAVVASMGAQIRRGEGFVAELLNQHKDGSTYWVHIEVQPIHDDQGRLTNFMAIERDITEARRRDAALQAALARAEQANQEKTDFLANVSHEIRTPLHTIIGMTALLREGQLGPGEAQLASSIAVSSEALLHIVNDLLDVAKIEAGQVTLETSTFDPIATCEEAITLSRSRIHPDVLVTLAHDRGPTPCVVGDPHRLRQIVVNLVGNALKFTRAGQVSVHVGWVNTGGSSRLTITVDDTGIGIPADERDRVFEKFYRSDTAEGRRVGGLGLGLSISQLLARAMGGGIHIEDKVGPGARFVLELELELTGSVTHPVPPRPISVVATAAAARKMADVFEGIGATVTLLSPDEVVSSADDSFLLRGPGGEAADDARLLTPGPLTPSVARRILGEGRVGGPSPAAMTGNQSGHLLVIDDNPDGQRYVRLVLSRAGFDVTTGGSVAEAIALAGQTRFTLIFMDISLPDGSGIEATRTIRAREVAAGLPPTPIVALSAHGMRHHRDEALAAGMNDYVTKPVKPDALIAVVARHRTPQAELEVEVEPDLADLVDGFLTRARQRAAAVQHQLDGGGETTELRRFAHDLKGTGAMFGFQTLSTLGADLESAVISGDLARARTHHATLRDRLTGLRWRVRSPSV